MAVREFKTDYAINLETKYDCEVGFGLNILELEDVDLTESLHHAILIPRHSAFSRGFIIPTTLIDIGFKGAPQLQIFSWDTKDKIIPAGTQLVQMVYIIPVDPGIKAQKGRRDEAQSTLDRYTGRTEC